MGTYFLHEVHVRPPDGLTCKFSMLDKQDDRPPILIVSFGGEYPDGSSGSAHGHYIATMSLQGLSAFDPWCIILDFREMTYHWGNTLLKVFQDISTFMNAENKPDEPAFPILAVTSERSRSGFLSLVTPAGSAEPDWHFNKIHEAIKAGVVAANAWVDA